MLLETW